jgi:predicted transcriptional regulator
MADREIEVRGDAGASATADFVAAWKAVEAGRAPEPTDRVYVQDWSVLAGVLSPARIDLLARLRREPGIDGDALSRATGRTAAEVAADIVALSGMGLVESDGNGRLTAPFAEVATIIRFAA